MSRSLPRALAVLALLLVAGCDRYDRLDRPLPSFQARTLDGAPVDESFFEGRPWVVNIWVPG